jgi:hypothetical protein
VEFRLSHFPFSPSETMISDASSQTDSSPCQTACVDADEPRSVLFHTLFDRKERDVNRPDCYFDAGARMICVDVKNSRVGVTGCIPRSEYIAALALRLGVEECSLDECIAYTCDPHFELRED